MKLGSTLAVAALCLSAYAAIAEDAPAAAPPAPSPEMKARYEACKADADKFCAAEIAARATGPKGAIGKCLDSHTAELSNGCKAARAERAAEKAKQ